MKNVLLALSLAALVGCQRSAPAAGDGGPRQDGVPAAVAAPVPAPAALAATIIDPARFADPVAREAYGKARDVADRLDKMYCYCHCHEHMGHRSLLTCFQGDHAAECGVCQHEAEQAWLDWRNGLTVEDSQRAADVRYNQGFPPPSRPD